MQQVRLALPELLLLRSRLPARPELPQRQLWQAPLARSQRHAARSRFRLVATDRHRQLAAIPDAVKLLRSRCQRQQARPLLPPLQRQTRQQLRQVRQQRQQGPQQRRLQQREPQQLQAQQQPLRCQPVATVLRLEYVANHDATATQRAQQQAQQQRAQRAQQAQPRLVQTRLERLERLRQLRPQQVQPAQAQAPPVSRALLRRRPAKPDRRECVAAPDEFDQLSKLPRGYAFSFSISAINAGTTVNTSPTTPKSATSKIGASASLLMATMNFEVCMPALC